MIVIFQTLKRMMFSFFMITVFYASYHYLNHNVEKWNSFSDETSFYICLIITFVYQLSSNIIDNNSKLNK